ncbi:MAG TPA: ABC transporter permease [Thermoanaerobaculia bacterium]|nr:ABC transporter permease [Thermoanaerobaculia bacterium]
MIRDIGQSIRRLLRRPGLTATAVVTLTLAIGANAAIFSLLDTVALRPLPYRDADQLVKIGAAVPGQDDLQEVSWPKLQALIEQSRETSGVSAYYQSTFGLTERDRPEELSGVRVSGGFFDVWGVEPVLGRTFTADEQKPGGPNVALLSYGFWRQRFGGDRSIVGRSLELEGVPTTIVGVLPDVLRFPFGDIQVWLPRPDEVNFMPRKYVDLGAGYLQVTARLKPGVSLTAAQKEIDGIVAAYKQDRPGQLDTAYDLAAKPLNELLVGSTRSTLLVLLAAVTLVLLIACADVANLLLADGLSRRREIAARIALGAGRRQIFGQALRESLLIAGAGGVLGVLLAHWALRLLVAANPADLPRIHEVTLSGRALAFAILVTAVAGVLAGLAPAWQTLRTDPKTFLAEGDRGAAGGARASWGQGLLVTVQVALALVLLSAAGLLLRSLDHVNSMELGFDPAGLLFVQVTLPEAKYSGVNERRVFFEELQERVRRIPGVQGAGLIEYAPTAGAPHMALSVEGRPPLPPDQQTLVLRGITSAGYFDTLKTKVVAGHDFDPRIAPDAPQTAIISRSLRDLVFPGENPLGQRVRLRGTEVPIEIIGVVEDIQQNPLEAGMEPMIFLFQHQAGPDLSPPNYMSLAIRSSLPMAGVADALRREVSALDPGEPLPEMQTMSAMLATATARRRLTTGLFSGFSALALVLSLLGIYGVVAHSIFLRRREIGVRMALGANRLQVLANVLRLGARWIVPGLVLGAIGSYFAGRGLASQLFEVEPTDWLHFTAAAAILGSIAFLACLVPARKATRIDPATTLRVP